MSQPEITFRHGPCSASVFVNEYERGEESFTVRSVAFQQSIAACAISLPGDVNESGSITSADIIYLVGYTFKGGPEPLPCAANGDVNCSGEVTSSDIIFMVNYVFKGGPVPCDMCCDPGAMACT